MIRACAVHPRLSGGSSHEFGNGHVEDVRDAVERRQCRIPATGFKGLEGATVHPRCEEQLLLAQVLPHPLGQDTLAYHLLSLGEPGLVVR